MPEDFVAAIEFETMVFGRHQADLTGRPRRTAGTLDHSSYLILNVLQIAGPQSVAELSGITGLTQSTLTRQTAATVADGYAEHILDPGGAIARKLRITRSGIAVLTKERALTRELVGEIVADWSIEERRSLAKMLKKLNNDIEKRSGRTWPRPSAEDIRAYRAGEGE